MEEEFPEGTQIRKQLGHRTSLVAPLLRESEAIGTISIRRMEVRPYSEKQIKLLETFADQAVIAIENVRLFQELNESLERQTATSEILGVIASSPTDIQPVLDVVAENAARLCDANNAIIHRVEGDLLRRVAIFGELARGQLEQKLPSIVASYLTEPWLTDKLSMSMTSLQRSKPSSPATRKSIVWGFGRRWPCRYCAKAFRSG